MQQNWPLGGLGADSGGVKVNISKQWLMAIASIDEPYKSVFLRIIC